MILNKANNKAKLNHKNCDHYNTNNSQMRKKIR